MTKKKYKVLTFSNDHVVHEIKTSQNIFNSSYLKKVEQIAKNCNVGGGFNGYTPPFFVRRVKYSYDEESG